MTVRAPAVASIRVGAESSPVPAASAMVVDGVAAGMVVGTDVVDAGGAVVAGVVVAVGGVVVVVGASVVVVAGTVVEVVVGLVVVVVVVLEVVAATEGALPPRAAWTSAVNPPTT